MFGITHSCDVWSWHLAASRSCAENPREMAGRETAVALKLLGFFPGHAKKEFGFASAPSCCCNCDGPQAGSVGRGGHHPCPGLVLQDPCTHGGLCHPKQTPLLKAARFWKVWRKQSTGTHLAVANCAFLGDKCQEAALINMEAQVMPLMLSLEVAFLCLIVKMPN